MLKDKKAIRIFNEMIERGIIPREGKFEVTDELLEQSFFLFRELFPPKTDKYPKPSEIKLAKRIAGLNFMKLLDSRTETVTVETNKKPQIKCGFVYIISNPLFPNKYKVGITTDVLQRLNTYQTYDPYRMFKIEHYRFVEDKRKTEKLILEKTKMNLDKGEWVSDVQVKTLLLSL